MNYIKLLTLIILRSMLILIIKYMYLSSLNAPERYDMTSFVHKINVLMITQIRKDLNIDSLVDHIQIDSNAVQKIKVFNLGSERFFESVNKVTVDYRLSEESFDNKRQVEKDINLIYENFNNLQSMVLSNLKYLSLFEAGEISNLTKPYSVNC